MTLWLPLILPPPRGCRVELQRLDAKYSELAKMYHFVPVALETMEPLSTKALSFLADLGRRVSAASGDHRETSFLFQRFPASEEIAVSLINSHFFTFNTRPIASPSAFVIYMS